MARRAMARRAVLVGGGALAACGAWPRRVQAALPADATYDVFLKGDSIGSQTTRFRSRDGGFEVLMTLDLGVKVLGFSAFSYGQEARELWQDGNLVQARIRTDDNGKKTVVKIDRSGNHLVVDGRHGQLQVPLTTWTDLSFWNKGVVQQNHLIDSQNGDLVGVAFTGPDKVTIADGGASIVTSRYEVTTSNGKKSGTLFYDQRARLVRSLLRTRGKELTLTLAE